MNITSLLITLAGIVIIIGLYLMSRFTQSKLPQAHETKIPNLKNKDGSQFTSLLDDIPARDGSFPKKRQKTVEEADNSDGSTAPIESKTEDTPITDTTQTAKTQQLILFISAEGAEGLDGNIIEKTLKKNKLTLGENDVYHYYVENEFIKTESNQISLFRVANGVSPWTLKAADLKDKKLSGLSIVMSYPTKVNSGRAIKTYIAFAKELAEKTNGALKNQEQQDFSDEDERFLSNLI
jgi:cell division protein ZipA